MAYNRGKALLGDAEFDALKLRLKQSGSIITAQGPRCSLRSKKMYSDAAVDYLRLLGINIPAALLVSRRHRQGPSLGGSRCSGSGRIRSGSDSGRRAGITAGGDCEAAATLEWEGAGPSQCPPACLSTPLPPSHAPLPSAAPAGAGRGV